MTTIEEACYQLGAYFNTAGLTGNSVITCGYNNDTLTIYLSHDIDVEFSSFSGWPVKKIVIGRVIPAADKS